MRERGWNKIITSRFDWRSDLVLFGLPLIFFAAMARAGTVMVDGDTYLHIVAGRWIIEHRQFIQTDFFTYTFFGAKWGDPEWLSEVAMAVAYALAGWSAVALLFSIAFGLTALLLARYLLRYLDPLPAAVVLGLALACIAENQSSRPYVLALPILAAWTSELLVARSEARAPHVWLLPLMMLWSNLHGSFVLGLSLAGFFVVETLVQARGNRRSQLRMWLLFAFGALAAAAINPNGFDGLLSPVRFMFRPILPDIADWASAPFSQIGAFEVALLAFIAFFVVRPTKVPIARVVLLLVLFHLALMHRRHIRVFVIVASMLLAEPIAGALGRAPAPNGAQASSSARFAAMLSAVAGLVIAVVRIVAPNPQTNMMSPAAAVSRVPPGIAARHVFNEDVLGGFLIWHGIRTFIDTREELVTDAFFQNYVHMCEPDRVAIVRTLTRYNIQWTILLPTNPANAVLDALPDWRVLYADRSAVVHVRLDVMRGRRG